jgi:citrate lyase beta subunit
MHRSLTPESIADITARLDQANTDFQARYPGDPVERRPVHSIYGGAHLFKAGGQARLGQLALASMDEHAPDFVAFAQALGLPGAEELPSEKEQLTALEHQLSGDPATRDAAWLAYTVHARVREKLGREPVEDQRADFEDGYGYRPDAEEDAHAIAVGRELARGLAEGTLPPFVGIRVKSLSPESAPRAIRTLDLAITALAEQSGGQIPANFVVTLPKVALPEQVAALAELLDLLEQRNGIAGGAIAINLMIETPQAIVDLQGQSAIGQLVRAGRGRVVSCAFGPYDYTASIGIAARDQSLDHPAADFARHAIQIALAGSGVALSDGPTNIMPIGPHRPAPGQTLSAQQRDQNRAVVQQAWRLHYDHVRRALRHGYHQGWDLHPAQLPARYAAVYAFYVERLDEATRRLRAFVERASQATLVGNTFDDAATGQGLLNFFLRGVACGALTEAEALAAGITLEELRERSFARIVANRTTMLKQ